MTTVTPSEFSQRWNRQPRPTLIDVRTPVEYRELHIDGARNVPLDQLDTKEWTGEAWRSRGETLYVVCKSGSRGQQACKRLTDAGVSQVVNIEGGTMACDAAGLPIIRGKKAVSLERQVRIAAGSLVVIGSALGYFVHPSFIGLAAFIGAGLVFAGVTDTCGMGMMLARMPWNRCATNPGSCSI
jgi:rhodanese-related sulfurtransferase